MLCFSAAIPASAYAASDLAEQTRTATIVAEFEHLSDAVMRTGQTPALAAVVVKDGAIVSVRPPACMRTKYIPEATGPWFDMPFHVAW